MILHDYYWGLRNDTENQNPCYGDVPPYVVDHWQTDYQCATRWHTFKAHCPSSVWRWLSLQVPTSGNNIQLMIHWSSVDEPVEWWSFDALRGGLPTPLGPPGPMACCLLLLCPTLIIIIIINSCTDNNWSCVITWFSLIVFDYDWLWLTLIHYDSLWIMMTDYDW